MTTSHTSSKTAFLAAAMAGLGLAADYGPARPAVPFSTTRKPQSDRKDKILAAQYGIPKAFHQHATRYGSGVDGIVAAGKKYPAALTLDQAAAVRRAERAAR